MKTRRKTSRAKRLYEAFQVALLALLSRLAPPVAYVPVRAQTPPVGTQLPVRFSAEIREGAGAFVILIIAAAAVVIAAAISSYVLNALGPATNQTIAQQGQQTIYSTVSSFGIVATLLAALIVGIIAFGFLKRVWREFAGG
jgi:hypothetical protein